MSESERDFLYWAINTLGEINPSNYNHDDVCELNRLSVEVSLAMQERYKDLSLAEEQARLSAIGNNDSSADRIASLEAEVERLRLMDAEFAKHTGLSLSFDGKFDCEDDNPDLWTVYKRGGGINDTEWRAIGRGNTPFEAMSDAIRALPIPPYPGGKG